MAATTTLAVTDAEREAAVIAGVQAYAESWRECLRQLPSCDIATLGEHRSGEQLGRATDLIDGWNAQGYEADRIDTLVTDVLSVTFFEGSQDGLVEICETDGVTIFNADDPGNQDFGSALISLMVVQDGATWKVYRVTVERSAVGLENNLCD